MLVEALTRGVARCADVHAMRLSAAIAVIEQHQIDVRPPTAPPLESCRDVVGERQPGDVAHRQPVRDRLRRRGPGAREHRLDAERWLVAHPELVDAMCARGALLLFQGTLESFQQSLAPDRAQRPGAGCRRHTGRAIPHQRVADAGSDHFIECSPNMLPSVSSASAMNPCSPIVNLSR